MPIRDLVGKNIALAGTFSTLLRATARELLTAAGATVSDGVLPTTDLVFFGLNGERLVEKAKSQGTPVLDERELRALLIAAGQLPGPQSSPVADPDEMRKVVEELYVFVEALLRRDDIRVGVSVFGRPTGTAELDKLRSQQVPLDLIQLHREVNGIHIEWRFVEPPGGGCLRIPAISRLSRFKGDRSHHMGFGAHREAMLFDEITPEGGTWLVRDKGSEDGTLYFASRGRGREGVIPARSIVEYLREAIAHGLVPYWPRCFRPSQNVSYAKQEQEIERFRAAPGA